MWKTILIIILALIIVAGGIWGWWRYSNLQKEAESAKNAGLTDTTKPGTKSGGVGSGDEADAGDCASLTDEERDLSADWSIENNATHDFSYKHPRQWQAAISNNDQMASFAQWPWGDESLAAVNLIVVVGDKVADFPVGALVEESHRTVPVGCVDATYTVYEKTHNERWDKDEYHLRTIFAKDGVPYLIILNYPFQGASADGDVVEAYDIVLKTLTFS